MRRPATVTRSGSTRTVSCGSTPAATPTTCTSRRCSCETCGSWSARPSRGRRDPRVELSEDQANALDRVVNWFQAAPASTYCEGELCEEEYPHTHGNAHGYPVLSIGGLAGSGKTWLTGQLSEVL